MRIVNNSTYKYVHFTIQEVLNIECEEFRVIFIWGNGITATDVGKDWKYSWKALHANKTYFEEINKIYRRCNMDSPYSASQIERLEKEFARNSYRVLLTRATTMTHILVEDQETFDYLHQFIPAYGD